MRILYVSLSYLPSRRASSVQVMKMCSALAELGHDVRLVGKKGDEPAPAGLHAFYGVPARFAVEAWPRPKARGGGLVYAARVAATLLRSRSDVDLVYCRDLIGGVAATQARLPTLFEVHGIPAKQWQRRLLRSIARAPATMGFVSISNALKDDLIAQDLAPTRGPIVVAHDAADPPTSDAPAKRHGTVRVGYVGNLYPGRGIEMVVACATRLPQLAFEVIGGTERDLAHWRQQALPSNLQFCGFVPPGELPQRTASFDILLLPHPRSGVRGASGGDISRWCSPMKMFEYMAAGAAIVTSDLPVLQEVLRHEQTALVASAGDETAWVRAIERLAGDSALRTRLGTSARADLLANYTWPARAATILSAFPTKIQSTAKDSFGSWRDRSGRVAATNCHPR